ncbi:dipeptidase [Inquilinus limosus]|uniref:dipeptidase n=1 Tax=Inquilinus limosus TaxID=171674 RepID=UPI0003FE7675|nr:dipeptidase [Inquilinus limosus]
MSTLDQVLSAVDAGLDSSLDRLMAFLRQPSISTDPAFKNQCRAAAEWLAASLGEIGFTAGVRPTPGHPMVVGHAPGAGAGPSILFYGHYDVQPVDPLELWDHPPFEPRIETGADGVKRIRARGASDDKGQLLTFLEACRAWKAVTGSLPLPITVFCEGEEESGSPSLNPFLEANRQELSKDLALVCDTGMWDPRTPAITTSLRGMVYEQVTITAANRDLHSGMYGGSARNPIHVLARILAALHDDDGRVTVPGFYDGVPETPTQLKAQWQSMGFDEADFLGQVGLSVPAGERDRTALERLWARPTCEVNGIWGGYTGEGAKTVIPSQAHAKVSFRLVGDQDPDKVRAAFHDFVQKRLPADCSAKFWSRDGSPALSLPIDNPALTRARGALQEEWGRPAMLVGSGGSIPVVGSFKRLLGMDSLLVGFALDDDRVHSPNEKYDLTSFHKGIRSWARILAALAEK